jgi:hypothetical protein
VAVRFLTVAREKAPKSSLPFTEMGLAGLRVGETMALKCIVKLIRRRMQAILKTLPAWHAPLAPTLVRLDPDLESAAHRLCPEGSQPRLDQNDR